MTNSKTQAKRSKHDAAEYCAAELLRRAEDAADDAVRHRDAVRSAVSEERPTDIPGLPNWAQDALSERSGWAGDVRGLADADGGPW